MANRIVGNNQSDRTTHAGGMSRRQAMFNLAALAASSYSMRGWTDNTTNWPLWTVGQRPIKLCIRIRRH